MENEGTMPQPEELETQSEQINPEEALMRAGGGEVDADKLARMRATMEKFKEKRKVETTTDSGSEAVDDLVKGFTGKGEDVDWSEYDLDYSVRHLYPTATYRETTEGMRWVAMVDEFISTERDYKNYGKQVHGRDGGFEPLNLGQYLNDMLNGPQGWKLVSLLPGSSGRAGLLLQRKVPMALPDPVPLKKETEVEAPTDPELERMEAAVSDFMAGESLTPPAEMEDTGHEPPVRPALEQLALDLNAPTERTPRPMTSDFPDMEAARVESALLAGEEAASLIEPPKTEEA